MTKQLEALIAEMKAAAEAQDKYMRGGAFSIAWDESITPKNVMALIAALEQTEKRMLELEARPVAVKLPKKNIGWDRDGDDCWNNAIDACAEAIRAAGGAVEGE